MPTDPLAPTDPFSRDDILSMTHQPEPPNPVPGIVKPAMDYLTSGDMMPAHKPGTQPKDYLRELLQYPDIMAKNIEQASNFAGMAGTLKGGMKPPSELYHVAGSGYKAGQPLQSLYKRLGDKAYEAYAERWPEAGDMGQYHAHQTFFYDNLKEAQEHVEAFGGQVIKVDPSKVKGLSRDNLEIPYGKKEGYWVTGEDVPANALTFNQASNFAGMAGTTGAKPPRYLVTSPEGKKYILTGPPEANVLPRNPGRAYVPNRPINAETLAEMRQMQEEMGAPDMGGRPIHPDVLKAMREEQEE